MTMITNSDVSMASVPEHTLVSIGMPTFNRPLLLERALTSLTRQTWRNLEIIISDNASTDESVSEVIHRFAATDERIKVFRQEENIGPTRNFYFVLKQATSPFFMWAADDDYIAPWFVEKSLQQFYRDPSLALSTFEANYVTPEGDLLDFIAEGDAFRSWRSTNDIERLHYMLEHNFGNLVYGLFRREALILDEQVFWELSGNHSMNEIPPLLYSALVGNVSVSPDIGLFKQVPASVHSQVKWEKFGGRLPKSSRISSLKSIISTWKYHSAALIHIREAAKKLPIPEIEKVKLVRAARTKLLGHFVCMILSYKPRAANAKS